MAIRVPILRAAAVAGLSGLLQLTAVGTATAADPPALVTDINVLPASSYPQAMVDVGGVAWFFACDGSHNLTLYTNDGTGTASTPIKKVAPCGSEGTTGFLSNVDDQPPVIDAVVGGRLFFTIAGYFSDELWVSDGTAPGTQRLSDDLTLQYIADLMEMDGQLYFAAKSPSGDGLWTSDGTPEGTLLVKAFSIYDVDGQLAVSGHRVYLQHVGDLWSSDGTGPGTARVADINSQCGIGGFVPAGGRLFFIACPTSPDDSQLWTTDGTALGTHIVKDIHPGAADDVANLVALGSKVFFTATDATHGNELWKSSGTLAGTKMLLDIEPSGSSKPQGLIAAGTRLSFTARDNAHGRRLWTTLGNVASTLPVSSTLPKVQVAVGNDLFFLKASSDMVWVSDGSASGTVPIVDPDPAGDAKVRDLTSAAGKLFFTATESTHGRELWSSDGTVPGTGLADDINTATLGSLAMPVAAIGGKVLFTADDGIHGRELYSTDGTELGTQKLSDAPVDASAKVGSLLYFASATAYNAFDLWKSDGTTIGTTVVKHIPYSDRLCCDAPLSMVALGGKLYLSVSQDGGYAGPGALWASDGTSAGTVKIRTWKHGSANSLTRVGSELYMVVALRTTPCTIDCVVLTLWKTDGTTSGTLQVGSQAFFEENNLTSFAGRLYFTQFDELWQSDGTSGGTKRVKKFDVGDEGLGSMTVAGSALYFTADRYNSDDDVNVPQLWVTNGTTAGTALLREFVDPRGPGELTALGSTLYFGADDQTDVCCGYELWRSDGTPGSTIPVSTDLFGDLSQLTNVGGTLYFAGQSTASSAHGIELWTSDGTEAGTLRVTEIDPNGSSRPAFLFASGGNLYLDADDGVHGDELWVMPL